MMKIGKSIIHALSALCHGETAYIIGKGPTRRNFDFESTKSNVRIFINDAGNLGFSEKGLYDFNSFIDIEAFERVRDWHKLNDISLPHTFGPTVPNAMECPSNLDGAEIFDFVYSRSYNYDGRFRPAVEVTTRSSEACLDILGYAGFRKIVCFGINGGIEYDNEFKNLERIKPKESHDCQWKHLDRITAKHGIEVKYN